MNITPYVRLAFIDLKTEDAFCLTVGNLAAQSPLFPNEVLVRKPDIHEVLERLAKRISSNTLPSKIVSNFRIIMKDLEFIANQED